MTLDSCSESDFPAGVEVFSPSITISRFENALALEQRGEYAFALNELESCLSQEGVDKGELFFHCGWCEEQSTEGDKHQALFYYRVAAEIAGSISTRINAHFRSGWLLMHDEDNLAASLMFRKAIDLADSASLHDEVYPHAMFWHASTLESLGRFVDAIHEYRRVQEIAPLLAPESLYREIVCLNQVGLYEEALRACRRFDSPHPEGFDNRRYTELCALARTESDMLEKCLEAALAQGA